MPAKPMGAKQLIAEVSQFGSTWFQQIADRGEHFISRAPSQSLPLTKDWAKYHRPRARQCFMNSQKFALHNDCARYFEGYWSAQRVPVWHAWVVIDGRVYDFTAEACKRKLRREGIRDLLGPDDQDYFGLQVPTEFIRESILKTKLWQSVLSDYLRKIDCGRINSF